MATQPILIDGEWKESKSSGTFSAVNPATKESLADVFPISSWDDCEEALTAAFLAYDVMKDLKGSVVADFLEAYAQGIESRQEDLVNAAHAETALPKAPRLSDVEFARTLNQIRLAAEAARSSSWTQPTIDTQNNIRSMFGPLGPVVIFGPNNFPFAFGSISGGDFVAAIAAGNPVIAKAHPSHPLTTKIFAEEALKALKTSELPDAAVQMIYMVSEDDGCQLVSDPRVEAVGFTGSQKSGLVLKNAAEEVGNLIYLEMSSINPVVILPGALEERGDTLPQEFTGSCLMGTGQFCTNPGLLVLLSGDAAEKFIQESAELFKKAPAGILLSSAVEEGFKQGIQALKEAGAQVLAEEACSHIGYTQPNTLLRITAEQFLGNVDAFETEAFGNSSLIVVADSVEQIAEMMMHLDGNLTGCVYSHTDGRDDEAYDLVAKALRPRVGRLLNDVMPTGVAVSAAMNHGGPFPATSHPGFTAVGLPSSIARYGMLRCYDKVRAHRLPEELADENPTGSLWRLIDGDWSQGNVEMNSTHQKQM